MIKQIVEVNDIKQDRIKRSNSGGVMLIMRLVVISMGFLLAITASGLPLDKLTILISALGVGIGFGLQNIINNLVSGVIIAVERPFRVGDLVNFGGVEGTVKMIGIRSSVVTSQNGSELIIPNGDLISKNLINWTSNNRFRRDNLNIEINSNIDDGDFIKLINDTILNSEINNFITGHQLSVISYNKGIQKWELSFWITDIGKYSYIRSKTIQIIYGKLNENKIEVVTFL
jgi:small-conductance mechanosensitive channel